MNSELLEKLGLSKNESKVYIALVKLGSAFVTEIAKKTNVHRVNIYDVLESLQEKGLVASVIKINKKIFSPANPEELKKLLIKKEEELKQTEQELSELSNIFKKTVKREVQLFKGKLGLKTVLKDVLTSKTEILNYGSSGMFPSYYPEYFNIWESHRAKNKIKMKIITSKSVKGKVPKKKLQTIKFLDTKFQSLTSTFIYENKIAIFMWTEDPIAILIENRELGDSYRNYFNVLWKIAKI